MEEMISGGVGGNSGGVGAAGGLDAGIAKEMLQTTLEDLNLDRYKTVDNPKLILLGGQPASGKSSAIEGVVKLYGKDNIVVLNSDDYKEYYPNYSTIVAKDPNKITEIHPYSNHVLGEVLKETAPRSINTLLEGTMRSSEYPLQVAEGFKSCGYNVEAYFVSSNGYSSTVGHLERFETEVADRGFGRAVPQAHHDNAYNHIPGTIEKLVNSGKIDSIKIVDRNSNEIADSAKGHDVVKAYTTHRETITPAVYKDVLERIERVNQMMTARGANASEIDNLATIKAGFENAYLKTVDKVENIAKDVTQGLESSKVNSSSKDSEITIVKDKTTVNDVLNHFEKFDSSFINKLREDNHTNDPQYFVRVQFDKPEKLAEYINNKLGNPSEVKLQGFEQDRSNNRGFER